MALLKSVSEDRRDVREHRRRRLIVVALIAPLPVIALRPMRRRAYDIILGFGAGLMIAAATRRPTSPRPSSRVVRLPSKR